MDGADLIELAAGLAGEPIASLEPVGGGRNSRVYRARTAGASFALKLYPPDEERDRLGQEWEALTFLREAGIGVVPAPIARAEAKRAALYGWLSGEPVTDRRRGDLKSLASFLERIHRTRSRRSAAMLRPAVEAVTSGAELCRQLEARLERLRAASLDPGLRGLLAEIAAEVGRRPIDEAELAQEHRTLSPSDIGFHNALRPAGGGLAFVDFEYFGWDDPVKLTSDILWHPGHGLDEAERLEFRSLATEIYSGDPQFEARLAALYPVFGLRWALIVLNEFIPKVQIRRTFAGETGERREIEEHQLAKARDLLARVRAV